MLTITVPGIRVGMFALSGVCNSVWQASSLPHYSSRHGGELLNEHELPRRTDFTQGVMIWQPYIRSNGEWIAAKLVQGFFGAPVESLAEISVSGVVFPLMDFARDRRCAEILSVLHA